MIFTQLSDQLNALNTLVVKLTNEQYSKKIQHLSNASIGSHTRHIIELLQCTITGYHTGEVDYINRKRNLQLEVERNTAMIQLNELAAQIRLDDKKLKMAVEHVEGGVQMQVFTTYYREIVYNTEHMVHHLALIKVALVEMKLAIVNNNFGMAASTIRYNLSLADAEQ